MNGLYRHEMQGYSSLQFAELKIIGAAARQEVSDLYGSGYPYFIGGQDGGLAFHGLHHTDVVHQGTALMCDALGLELGERAIAESAALAHDVVQKKPRGQMERESAEWLAQRMHGSTLFTEQAVTAGRLAVLGTEPIIEDDIVIGQVATRQEYPSQAAEQIALSVACGDFGEMYSPMGLLMSYYHIKELNGVAPNGVMNLDGVVDKMRIQLELVDRFRFAHPLGERVFARLRSQVVARTARVLGQLERGEIETWDQLMAQGYAFLREHSA